MPSQCHAKKGMERKFSEIFISMRFGKGRGVMGRARADTSILAVGDLGAELVRFLMARAT